MAGGRENEGGETYSWCVTGVIQGLRRLVRVGELLISDWLLCGFIISFIRSKCFNFQKFRSDEGNRLGVDRVKPWNSVRINLGLGLRPPDIRPGLKHRHLIIEGHRGLRR